MLRKSIAAAALAAFAAGAVSGAAADDKPVKPWERKEVQVKPPEDSPLDYLVSGYWFRTPKTRALQDDDFENPAFLWVEQAMEEWTKVDGKAGKSCASCHETAEKSMKGVSARYPVYSAKNKKMMAVQHQVNYCRKNYMKAKTWKWESDQMLGMAAYIGLQSRGMPVKVSIDGPAKKFFEAGDAFYHERRGQFDLACMHCHQANFGQYIRADLLSQGHSNGFPTYRLKWQKLGSLHRRFRGCNNNIRAIPYKRGSPEYTNLELYLAWRGMGLKVESPSVRQ